MPGLKSIGSYRSVLELLHIPYAKLIMDGVILLSVTSCLNSALYTASRMLYSLSRRGDAPAIMGRTNRSKLRTWRCCSPPARRSSPWW